MSNLKNKLREVFYKYMPDTFFLKRLFQQCMGYPLNLHNPATFNEKLNWLKLYNRNPLYTKLVDKYAVKQWVAGKIGEQHIIPTIGVWNKFDKIKFNQLPNQFVLKSTHDSAGIAICKDFKQFDINAAREKITNSLKRNYYHLCREWPYKNVIPQIIAEKYMEDENNELKDYKFFCFNGVVKFVQIDSNRFSDHHRTFYDCNWNLLPYKLTYPVQSQPIEKPINYEQMLDFAKTLSKGFPFVRVDMYNIKGQIFFGEMTFFPGAGFENFEPDELNYQIGEWLKLPKRKTIP